MAGISSSGRWVKASTASAVRLPVKAASTSGTRSGNSPRVVLVSDSAPAMNATGRMSGCDVEAYSVEPLRGIPRRLPRDDEPAEQAGRRVVGMALHTRRDLQDRVALQLGVAPGEHDGGHRAADRGGGGAAQPPRVRDGVAAAHPQAGGASPVMAHVVRIARTTRCASSQGTRPAPSPSTSTVTPCGATDTSMSS